MTPRPPRSPAIQAPPAAGAALPDLLKYLTAALRLPAGQEIEAVQRFGRSRDARLVVVLQDGRITFERQADALDHRRLVQTVVMAVPGADTPTLNAAEALAVGRTLMRAAELLADDDDRQEVHEWTVRYLGAVELETIDLTGPAGRYAMASVLRDATRRAVRDEATGDLYVSTFDFKRFIRDEFGLAVDWRRFTGRVAELGWDHLGKKHVRRPGGRAEDRVKVSLCRLREDTYARAIEGDTGGQGDNDRGTTGDSEEVRPAGTCPKCDAPWQPPDEYGDVSCPNGHWHPEEGTS